MPQKLIILALIVVFWLCCVPLAAQQKQPDFKTQKRIALVIGNSNYQKVDSLQSGNTSDDASDVAEALRLLGFKVYFGIDQNFREILALINDFGTELEQSKGIGLFYYTGHGFNIDRENYLLPIDTRILQETDSTREGVSLNILFSKMKSAKNAANFVFLDLVSELQFVQSWRTEQDNFVQLGFTKIMPPAGTVVIYSNQPNDLAARRFGRNGFFAASFLKHIYQSNLEFGQFANAVADNLAERTFNQQKLWFAGDFPKSFYFVDELHKPPLIQKKTLAKYFEKFKMWREAPCGKRDEARSTAKEIIENYENDVLNAEVISYVKNSLQKIEKEDKVCDRNSRYDASYKAKNWLKFFEFSKEVIAAEGETPLAVDVMLTLVRTGYNIVVMEDDDNFNADTIFYAKKAIELIDKGVAKESMNLGTFNAFERESSALDWCHYIIGYIKYFRLNQRAEGVSYLYKSFKYTDEFKSDWTVYQTIGDYYFDITMNMYENYREKKKANINKDNDETRAILMLALGYADRAIDAYGRARKIFADKKITTPKEKVVFNDNLNEVYIFRFNFVPKMPTWGMDEFIVMLNSKPMPEPTKKVEPVPIL